jgi:Zn-dependent M32 family carboxypeptidase
MLTRLKKVWRMVRGKEEYALTVEESKVLRHVLRTLMNYLGYGSINLNLWNKIMTENDPTLLEDNLSDVMKSLATKLLKQQDYD